MEDSVTIALVGLFSAIAGGIIQALASGRIQQKEMSWKAKWDLYAAYFVSLGDLTFYPRESERYIAALAAMAQIRARIALYGSTEVIQTVAHVFTFPDLNSPAAQIAMSDALQAMRKDVGQASGKVSAAEMKKLMFNQRDEE